jgi:hypothetical protein
MYCIDILTLYSNYTVAHCKMFFDIVIVSRNIDIIL